MTILSLSPSRPLTLTLPGLMYPYGYMSIFYAKNRSSWPSMTLKLCSALASAQVFGAGPISPRSEQAVPKTTAGNIWSLRATQGTIKKRPEMFPAPSGMPAA